MVATVSTKTLLLFSRLISDPKISSFLGDLTNGEKVLDWLTSQDVYSIGDQIEDVNRKMLGKILAENDFVAVYFCKLFDPAPIYFNLPTLWRG